MSREVIATDIDEVLFPFVQEFAPWHNQEYGTKLGVVDFVSYEFDGVLSVPVPETIHRIHTFLSVEHGHLGVAPLKEAQEAIAILGEKYDIKAVTARHPRFENPTVQYLMHYFEGMIADVTLVGHIQTMDVIRTKAEVCHEIGAIALIDDSVQHVFGCAQDGIQGVLFGDYPWNQVDELPVGVVRHKNWNGVLEYFNGQA